MTTILAVPVSREFGLEIGTAFIQIKKSTEMDDC